MSLMTEALARIDAHFNSARPARSREAVEQQIGSFFQFQLSEEVYEYYQWAGAPIGDQCPVNGGESTYTCRFDGLFDDGLIHFLSLEEAAKHYQNHTTNPEISDIQCLPFVLYENGELVIAGSEPPIDVSAVLVREDIQDQLWFPSLTNMMLAIAESLETVGSIDPSGVFRDADGVRLEREAEKHRRQQRVAIAKKYGSPKGLILTN
ncbi:hypothetical protein IQ266_24305 [filamentous cyanobacterium LEGE 11480]|uniref:SMI1/KNR4 family protein n=1 Tax=Romeriopsis navalis LEGE 11480 TaxID=2777977 RepID=A0A928VQF3_9CYAN|nr:hypothetical protein [Romeriopsis navalis]MBE9032863.1 hypothetical protein [Romeriopsis navalis LEGE 11480]